MNPKSFATAFFFILALSSCKRENVNTYVFTNYSQDILSERTSRESRLLTSTSPSPKWDIAIIGTEESARRLSEDFCNADNRENVSGAHTSDYLPDFAGETFVCIIDSTGRCWSTDKEVALRHVMTAIDTLAHISPYDLKGLLTKNRSKMVILADPFLSCMGKSEVDSLFSRMGCTIPVLSPTEIMLSRILPGRKGLNVGIICDKRFCKSGIYYEIFSQIAERKGAATAECFVECVSDSKHPLRSFLDKYMQTPQARPLDVIVVEDADIDFEKVKADMADLISVMNEESVTYNSALSKDCVLYESSSSLLEESYNILRNRNLFTHNIAKPRCMAYFSQTDYILVPESYVQN